MTRVWRGGLALLLAFSACDAEPSGSDDLGDTGADVVETDTLGDVVDEGLGVDYTATSGGAVARYEPDGEGFTRTPWPSDHYRRADGTIDLSFLPNPNGASFITDYLSYGSEAVDGYSRNGAVYFELSGLLDPAALPSDEATLTDPSALAQLVDVTPGAATTGQRFPLVFHQTDGAADPYYVGPTLAMRPVYGFPLADAHTYCAFLTRALVDASGNYLERAPAFADALDTDETLAPLRDWLYTSPIGREDIAAATCFTTQNATREMRAIQGYIDGRDTGELFDVEYAGKTQYYSQITAMYAAPNFQQGVKPYTEEGGDVAFEDGVPLVAELEPIRVRMLIPRNYQMPDGGWPVVLYSHGTGGDWESCLDATEGDVPKDGLAMICIDQPLHGIRGVGDDSNYLNSFNFFNPRSGRMSFRQAAADTLWLSLMVTQGRFDLGPNGDGWGKGFRMDPDKILFFGHSHGGLAGIIALGVDPRLTGAVLSGASGVLTETILRRKDPVDIASLLAAILGIDTSQLDTFHPILTLAQTLVDATDPINYAPYWLSPVTGGRAKHVLMTEGTEDEASPSVGTDAVAAAAGVPLIVPVEQQSRAHELRGLVAETSPVSGNLSTTTGAVITGGLKQYAGGDHFVAFTTEVRSVWRTFLRGFRSLDVPVISL